jgi:hypothetical protein
MDDLTITQLIGVLEGLKAEHGDLPCVYEQYGHVNPEVHEVDGRLCCDLAAKP